MISTEIYVEDYKLDLVDEISTEFSYAIDDIQDFGSRNTSFSKTINITGTANNNKIFGFIFDLGSANITDDNQPNIGYNFNASKVAKCRIFIDKIQIFKGVLRILEIINDAGTIEYQCAVFGELGGFISAIGNNRLEDLSTVTGGGYSAYSSYNQAWDVTNILDQTTTISNKPVVFGLIDIGNVSSNKVDFDFRAFRPCFKVKEILEKIRIQAGYKWEFPYLTNSLFDRLVIPNNSKILSNSSTQAFYAEAVLQTYNTNNYPAFTPITLGNFVQVGSSFRYNSSTPLACKISLQLYGDILDVFPDPPNTVTVSLRVNGSNVEEQTFPIFAEPSAYYVNFEYNTTLNLNDTIEAYVTSSATSYDVNQGFLKVDSTTATDVPINYGETIQMDKQLPRGIFQRDFFLSICKMLNLYVYDDPVEENKIIIKPYIDFYSGATEDWTNKIDRSKPMSIKPMSEINARYYQFKFKQDNDVYNENYRKKYNEGYGDNIFDTTFDFVKDTDTTEVIFSSSPLYRKQGTDKIYPAIYKVGSSNVEESIDFNIRIFQAKYITGMSGYAIKDGSTNKQSNVTTYTYVGHLDDPFNPTNDINFGAPKEIYFTATTYPTTNLFNAFYSDYMAEITDKDSKLLTCNARLNTIEGYNPMDYTTTKVSLLKAIEKTF